MKYTNTRCCRVEENLARRKAVLSLQVCNTWSCALFRCLSFNKNPMHTDIIVITLIFFLNLENRIIE